MSSEGSSALREDFSACEATRGWTCVCPLCGEAFEVDQADGTRFLSEGIGVRPVGETAASVDPAVACAEASVAGQLLAMGVTDEAAERYLRLCHQRLGHASLRYLRQLHRSGDLLGPDISEAQFDCVQFHCPTCARTKQTRKPHVTNRKRPAAALRVLEEIVWDLEGPRDFPSVQYVGERGNLKGGGNYYTAYFVDKATERLFVSSLSGKTEVSVSGP